MSIGAISNHSFNNKIATNSVDTKQPTSNQKVTTNTQSLTNGPHSKNMLPDFNPYIINNSGTSNAQPLNLLPVIDLSKMFSGALNRNSTFEINSALTGLGLDEKVLDRLIKDSQDIHEASQNTEEHIAAQRESAQQLLKHIMNQLYNNKTQPSNFADKVEDLKSPLV